MEDGGHHPVQEPSNSPGAPSGSGSGSGYGNSERNSNNDNNSNNSNEPVRSRWCPKPEQFLILASIFNSGMVNPPRDETVRIRQLLEKFGAVGDANVFYWFQNRRSRSRHRQRQIQAILTGSNNQLNCPSGGGAAGAAIMLDNSNLKSCFDLGPTGQSSFFASSHPFGVGANSNSSSSSCSSPSSCVNHEGMMMNGDMFSNYCGGGQMCAPGIEQNSSVSSSVNLCPSTTDHYNSGMIIVFINGVATEVPRGPLNMKGMLGEQDLVLVHASGVPLQDYGFTLQHGESYFLVPRTT